VCSHSLNRCGDCGRSTCREHVGLCHAAEGQPVKIVAQASEEKAAPPEPSPPPAPVQEPEKPHVSSLKRKKMERERQAAAEAVAARRNKAYESLGVAVGHKIEVRVDAHEPVVMAGVLTAGNKPIAVRTWELVEDGVLVTCQCEKSSCPADDMIFEPEDAANVEAQIEYHLDRLRQEYRVPAGRVTFFSHLRDTLRPMRYFTLHGAWKDEAVLSDVRAAFRKTYAPRRR
jgi:hypothetical protein